MPALLMQEANASDDVDRRIRDALNVQAASTRADFARALETASRQHDDAQAAVSALKAVREAQLSGLSGNEARPSPIPGLCNATVIG
jgi:hypothetical protein